MIHYIIENFGESPESAVDKAIVQLLAGDGSLLELLVSYPFVQYWLPEQPLIQLTAGFSLTKTNGAVVICFAVSAESVLLADLPLPFTDWCLKQGLAIFSADRPLSLQPLKIPKPWGQEIWYTGIEQRGVVSAVGEGGMQLLPYVLSALPQRLCACRERQLILLKILDPLPEPVFGDLYFELHQQKREVYVVTHVDAQAWPNQIGAIRFGFNDAKRAVYSDAPAFKAAFAQSVQNYEAVRRQLDAFLDVCRLAEGYPLNEPLSASVLSTWLQQAPEALRQQEFVLRQQMEAFTDTVPLEVGDVVKVPCLTPHSLQHGVRTVEFQTPVYERLIVSFAQKVLTQSHWDTAKAIEIMAIEAPIQQSHELLVGESGLTIERIVDFEDFEVRRVTLNSEQRLLITPPTQYGLLMSIESGLNLNGSALAAEQGLLLPNCGSTLELYNPSPNSLKFLLAYPK